MLNWYLEGFRTYLPQISRAYYTATSMFMPKLPNSTLTSLRVGSTYTLGLTVLNVSSKHNRYSRKLSSEQIQFLST